MGKRLAGAFLLLTLIRFAGAQTLWIGQTGDWFDPANWSDGVPDSSADGQINNRGTAQILNGTANANNLTLGGSPIESNTGSLIVAGPASLEVKVYLTLSDFGIGTLMILGGGQVNSGMSSILGSTHFGGLPGVAVVDGAGSTWNTTFALDVDGSLTIQNSGAVTSDAAVINGAAVIDGPGATWTTGAVLVSTGAIGSLTIQNGGLLLSDDVALIGDYPGGAFVLVTGPGSKWENDFDQVRINIDFDSAMSITNGGVVSTFAVGVGANGGSNCLLTVDGSGSALNVRTNLYVGGADFGTGPEPGGIGVTQISNDGVINSPVTTIFGQGSLIADGVLNSQDIKINVGGSFSGNGTITGDVTNDGEVEPGDSIGTLGIAGSYTQSSTGILTTEIGGLDPHAHDFLSIAGDATLDGTLEVRFVDGFLPTAGQVFDLVGVSGAASSSFAQVIFPDLRSGFQFSGQLVNGVYDLTALSDGAPAIGLRNISTRGLVAPDDDALIAGFIVTGSEDKQVIIRGLGPSLTTNGVSLPGRLADPTLELHDNTGALLSSNDNWMDSPDRQEIIDSTIQPQDDREAAVVATLAPGVYTAILRGAGGSSGIGVVEAYDLSPESDSTLANISTRGLVGTADEVMIGGFIADDQETRVLVRALGPSLVAQGIEALADPALELHNGDGELVASNNDWQDSDQAEIENTGIPPQFPQESAILTTLEAGDYTAIIRGQDGGTGVGLLEIYNLR